jgi:hypothetical protein
VQECRAIAHIDSSQGQVDSPRMVGLRSGKPGGLDEAQELQVHKYDRITRL